MKKAALLLGGLVVALLAWLAAGTPQAVNAPRPGRVEKARTPPVSPPPTPIAPVTLSPATAATATDLVTPATTTIADAIAAPADPPIALAPASTSIPQQVGGSSAPRPLLVPVSGIDPSSLHDMFDEVRGNRRHEAIDIFAPRGTPVIATDDGLVKKLFTSVPGGLTIYQFDPDEKYCYYYAHLDRYTAGLHEGQHLQKGEVIAYVGTTGNAPKETPHLHFAVIRLDPDKRWWKGTYINPYPLLYRPHKP